MELIEMNEMMRIKNDAKFKNWLEIIEECQSSEKTVSDWCRDKEINIKTYYYWLQKAQQNICKKAETHEIIPVNFADLDSVKSQSSKSSIIIKKCELSIELPNCINTETLTAILKVLQC